MRCPYCGKDRDKVVDTRPVEDGSMIRRRRMCLACGKRFTTYERVERLEVILVRKRDGNIEPFDREKIIRGIMKACEKRPVKPESIERIVSKIEQELYKSGEREVSSVEIGEMVMGELKKLDDVAYVRFASVYRQFEDIDRFVGEIKDLIKKKGDKKKKR
ncbi:MAG: transcriptional regulator NrdR [Candidatus Coatesbacteria bacterium 4484_99]|uniref:Transcriptional repressor NrdR n=1 Tax=Candidatus Coatesbacteria bacterium 4484_99 TaxID=1970774 RepID=A0A1W9S0S2_9BACT|nr:MAG: transcriptional regulator NrdR [Candidatus Coatesbacteria bacterium 4484_99]RLC40975.1 MAG: transcriptional regulator NrdR [Candidatus Coatesbacteria bacterium]RLC42096.1 MAG: transcriptional regulator NrdR [Candidatus Coatesbacteria bacterium]RLC42865.1 MAG: transcriptional regulator NrdR [Candidatus Coatesbacteria bacterium]